MRRVLLLLLLLSTGAAWAAPARVRCPSDSVAVGPVCVDRYEASVWQVPEGNKKLINKIRRGEVTLAQLLAGGATQVNAMTEETCASVSYPSTFPYDGNWTEPLYAVSVPGVLPTTCTSWFQAEQTCRLSGKRLLTNADWQAAAAGTPDPGIHDDGATTCAVASPFGVLTGSRTHCRSVWGVHDMVGNAWEWVAEWGEMATGCGFWLPEMGNDFSCIGPETPMEPAMATRVPRTGWLHRTSLWLIEDPVPGPNTPSGIIRGGNFAIQERSGVYAYFQSISPTTRSRSTGFRCAR